MAERLIVPSETDFVLDNSGKFVQYDTLNNDPKYVDMEEGSVPDRSGQASPVSIGTPSIASDVDAGNLTRAESCDSIASDSSVLEMAPEMPKIGQLEFALEYDREVSELIVGVIQARDLAPNEYSGTLDTYIRGMLLPDNDSKFQTKVFAVDKYQRHKVIGEADIRVGDADLNQPIKMSLNLRDIDERHTEHGDIMFSLSYLPTAERLTIVVVKVRNLGWRDGKNPGDPFVKVYLLQKGKKISKKKTSVKRGDRDPIFNEAMIFSVPATALPTIQLRITVAEQLPEGKFASLGHVIIGADTFGTPLSHWNQMMTSLRKPVAMWHNLRK